MALEEMARAPIVLTDMAAERIKRFAQELPGAEGKMFRVFVQGGGCAGFQYGFTFDDRQDGDALYTEKGIDVLIDSLTHQYITGSKVDYVEDVRRTGFVVYNPNAVGSCCCGHSFEMD
jgi:iron-sulfur cluster insertion protein